MLSLDFAGTPAHDPTMGKPRATYRDIEALPEHVVGELIDGELFVSPRPAVRHAAATFEMATDLGNPFQRGSGGPGTWWFLVEPELHFGENVLVPDMAGWRKERMPRRPNTAAIELPPDWVCEVISPSTSRLDRVRKMPVYARVQARHVWLVDPIAQTVEVYRLDGATYRLVDTKGGAGPARLEPFDEIEIDLGRWWLEAAAPAASATPP